jgi:hypothetical protein
MNQQGVYFLCGFGLWTKEDIKQFKVTEKITECTQSLPILVSVVATKPSLKSHPVVMRFALSVFGKTQCQMGLGNTQLLIESN